MTKKIIHLVIRQPVFFKCWDGGMNRPPRKGVTRDNHRLNEHEHTRQGGTPGRT